MRNFMRNIFRIRIILLQALLSCISSKFRESYMLPAIRIRVRPEWHNFAMNKPERHTVPQLYD
jgi:hypothetical protein